MESQIGKLGTSLREISEESGAKIETPANEESEPGKKAFKLTGNTEAVEKASQIIDQIVQKIRDHEQRKSRGVNKGTGKGKDRKHTDNGKGKGKGWQDWSQSEQDDRSTATCKPTWKPKQ